MAAQIEVPKVANQWQLTKYPPPGLPVFGEHVVKKTVELPELEEGQVLVKVTDVTVDPYQRGVMNPVAYGVARELGKPIFGGAAGVVAASRNPEFPVGASVEGSLGWVDAAVVTPAAVKLRLLPEGWSRSHANGVLGMPGATAIFGVEEILRPQPGQVVFVSAAAGAVGNLVGQICKILGCKVYGSVGSDEKVKEVLALGFDGALNYKGKTAAQLVEEIKGLTGGKTIDRYFENTGGAVTDAVCALLSLRARIAICGQIALYNEQPERLLAGGEGISSAVFLRLLMTQSCAEAFLVGQFPNWTPKLEQLHAWIQEGKLKVIEDIDHGFDNIPEAWLSLYKGGNVGKKIVAL